MVKKQPLVLLFLTLLLGASCRDPIFYNISREVKPREPRIKGVPTKFVVYDGYMYVAAAALHQYKDGGWDQGGLVKPSGRVIDLAATTNFIYALVNPERPALWYWKTGWTEWKPLDGYSGSPQSIYGEIDVDGKPAPGGKVFLGVRGDPTRDGIDYSIFYVDETAATPSVPPVLTWLDTGGNTGFLTGAAFDGVTHFISTSGSGAYSWDGSGTPAIPVTGTSPNLMGIIGAGGTKVFSFSRVADIYEITSTAPSSGTRIGGASYDLTGAVALWKSDINPGEGNILLGIRDGSDYGYKEVPVDLSTGEITSPEMFTPGTHSPTTLKPSSASFDSTIEPHPVNRLFQAPDGVLFAAVQGTGSTTNDIDSGVWSYRERDGIWQWNAEE